LGNFRRRRKKRGGGRVRKKKRVFPPPMPLPTTIPTIIIITTTIIIIITIIALHFDVGRKFPLETKVLGRVSRKYPFEGFKKIPSLLRERRKVSPHMYHLLLYYQRYF